MKKSRGERRLLLQRQLERARSDPHGLAEASEFYGALIAALIEVEPALELPALDNFIVGAKLAQGQPILVDDALAFDTEAVRELLLKLCTVAEQFGQPKTQPAARRFPWSRANQDEQTQLRERAAEEDVGHMRAMAAAQIREALQRERIDFDRLLEQVSTGDADAVGAMATEAKLDPNLLLTLARFAMRPIMLAYAEAFEPAVNEDNDKWMQGVCPVCGGPPLLSEYRDHDQSRRLRCATCGTAWLFRRLQCAYCSNDKHQTLAYFTLADDPSHRVDTCEVCHHYLKAVNANELTPSDLLPLEDLLTLPLDVAAQQKGYQRI